MCGIVGVVSPGGGVDGAVLRGMRERLAHRGPDGAGTWISAEGDVGLAHRRLSIVDLSEEACQPMHARRAGSGAAYTKGAPGERGVSLVFNGEVYNHRELRAELEGLGYAFHTDHSDTEVLLLGYVEWGIRGLLRRLNGMFGFALHDRLLERVWLVRDRIGIKPLYLAPIPGTSGWAFASEAKALFEHPAIEARLDRRSFWHYLTFRAVPAPASLFAGVETLAAGELCEIAVRTGRVSRVRWWDPLEEASPAPGTRAEAVEALEALLESSVDLRLAADVPVGLFLSGGVDSGYLAKVVGERVGSGLDTFTIVHPGMGRYDEGSDASRIAREVGANHHEIPLGEAAFGDALARVAWHQDEPIAAPICTSVYYLSKAAREANVPVVLGGEGADEVFVGYASWIGLRNLTRMDRELPSLPGRACRRLAHLTGEALLGEDAAHTEILRRMAADQPLFWSGGLDFTEAAKAKLVGPEAGSARDSYQEVVAPIRERFLARADAADVTGWMSYADLAFRLPQLMLPRMDKMGMAFSIEGRVPFLDHRIVELVMGLPPEWRGGVGSIGKPLLKEVMARRLPRDHVYRKKRGFQAPVREWKRSALGERWLPALRTFAERTGLFEPRALDALLARPGDRLWFNLANFALWHCLYVEDVLGEGLREQVLGTEPEVLAA